MLLGLKIGFLDLRFIDVLDVLLVAYLVYQVYKLIRGSVAQKIFIGIMIGVSFQLINSLFSHIGLLNTWPPFMTAIAPSALFLFAAISACWWVERH